jgi:hypothetical protein
MALRYNAQFKKKERRTLVFHKEAGVDEVRVEIELLVERN